MEDFLHGLTDDETEAGAANGPTGCAEWLSAMRRAFAVPCLSERFVVMEAPKSPTRRKTSFRNYNMAKINGNEIRPGTSSNIDGGLWVAVRTNTVKPGKGGAYNQVELKNLINGTKLNERFRSAETVEQIRLDLKDFSFLYEQGDALVFMDTESYEQLELQKDFVGDRAAFLQDGMMVTVAALRRDADRHLAARPGDADHHRGRPGGEGPDRRVVLQAGGARKRHPRAGPALHRDRRAHHRRHQRTHLRPPRGLSAADRT